MILLSSVHLPVGWRPCSSCRNLPADLPAALFVVVHFPTDSTSILPKLLNRAGQLPATHPEDGEPIEPGRIYVAPPDSHLRLRQGQVRLVRGPRENGHRHHPVSP